MISTGIGTPFTSPATICAQNVEQVHSDLVNRLSTGDLSRTTRNDYYHSYRRLINYEFSNFAQLSNSDSIAHWQNVLNALKAEECPIAYDSVLSSGCSHIHMATALHSFITLLRSSGPSPLFFHNKVLPRLEALLENYIDIAIIISALRHHPNPNELNYEALVQEFLTKEALHLENLNEILFPVAYVAPDTKKGHFMLCKARKGQIQIFNALPLAHDKPIGEARLHNKVARVYQLRCAHTIRRNDSFEDTINRILAVLPLQLRGHMIKIVGANPEPQKLHRVAMEWIYKTLQSNGEPIEHPQTTLFSYTQYTEGNICVPMAFHMLIQSLTNHEVAKAQIPAQRHQEIKAQCDGFWAAFKAYVAKVIH